MFNAQRCITSSYNFDLSPFFRQYICGVGDDPHLQTKLRAGSVFTPVLSGPCARVGKTPDHSREDGWPQQINCRKKDTHLRERMNALAGEGCLLWLDQTDNLAFKHANRFVTRIGPLHGHFQNLLSQVALAGLDGPQTGYPGSILENRFLVG